MVMRYHITAGNSPEDLAVDIETDDADYVRQQQRLWPYVNISLLTPIPREAIDACLEGWRNFGRYDGGGEK
jgi:hypothetical protein